ncbi:hypothetical protein K4F52_008193 [Lecanicillium sp. MT-2017a]|nr:hypothetical protein K4F52_008193 [Lecanicillium sp. MT-2017a]
MDNSEDELTTATQPNSKDAILGAMTPVIDNQGVGYQGILYRSILEMDLWRVTVAQNSLFLQV